jgi:hypothetical protein
VLNILSGFLSTPANVGGQKGIVAGDINTSLNSGGIGTWLGSQSGGTGTVSHRPSTSFVLRFAGVVLQKTRDGFTI